MHIKAVPGFIGPALVFAIASAVLLSADRIDYPRLHDVLDAGTCVLSAILARSLWTRAARTDDALLRWLAASFAAAAIFELVHVLSTVEWTGPLAVIMDSREWLRPATWPPAAYVLPIGIISGIRLAPRRWTPAQIATCLLVIGAVLVPVLAALPRYTVPGALGISRPTLILVSMLWALIAVMCWNRRSLHRMFIALACAALLLFVAHTAMLYSQSPHDTLAMVAHAGKFCSYMSVLLFLTQTASEDARARLRAERELTAMNAALEETVRARTAELADSQMRTRAIFETALDGLITIDHTGRIVEFNAAAERIFGYRRDSVVGQKLEDTIVPPDQGEAHRHGLARYAATGKAHILGKRVELDGMRADGTIFPLELSVNRMPGGGPPAFAAFVRDIAARRDSDEKARAQLARLSLLDRTTRAIGQRQDLRSIFQVVVRTLEDDLPIDFGCVCLRDPGENELTLACIGSRSHILAKRAGLTEQVHVPIDENGLSRCMQGKLVYEPDIGSLDFAFPQKLARAGLRTLVFAPLMVENQVFGVVVAARCKVDSFSSGECEFLRQLSEHVALASHQAQLYGQLQAAYADLRETQLAVMQHERLRALGQMASGIAHDINNALSPASLYVQSLLERDKTLSKQARDYLEIVQRAIEDVAHTVARMREFYRPRDHAAPPGPVDLNKCLNQVIELTRARWTGMPLEHGIVIETRAELATDLPSIAGVESEIRDALTNLVLNAADAMPHGGTITLRSRALADGRVQIEVVDTGIGMSEKTRSRCLEPFFTTKGERGTGLGLAMVFGVVQRHRADLAIDSEPGVGTTMRITFPLGPAPLSRPAAEVLMDVGPLRILLIDDDPLLLESLRESLVQQRHDVTAVDGGQLGIDRFGTAATSTAPFDIVITDLGMPYIDGRTVASAIKTMSPRTPVILLTGWGHRLIAESETPAHVDRVLSKPPKLAEIRLALSELAQ